jgi:hypothetical protein
MKRCDHCGGRFGLVLHRHYTLRFCAKKCLEGGSETNSIKHGERGFSNGSTNRLVARGRLGKFVARST